MTIPHPFTRRIPACILTLAAVLLGSCERQAPKAPPAEEQPAGRLLAWRQGEWEVKVIPMAWQGDEAAEALQIYRKGQLVRTLHSKTFLLGVGNSQGPDPQFLGKDFLRMGFPLVGAMEHSGGAHGYYVFHLFGLAPEGLRVIWEQFSDGPTLSLEDLDKDGVSELIDWDALKDWPCSRAESYRPRIVLAYRQGAFQVAEDLMKKPAPERSELEALSKEIRDDPAWRQGYPPKRLCQEVLDLAYSGNLASADRLLAAAWPTRIRGQKAFQDGFHRALRQSRYWDNLAHLNAGKVDAKPAKK